MLAKCGSECQRGSVIRCFERMVADYHPGFAVENIDVVANHSTHPNVHSHIKLKPAPSIPYATDFTVPAIFLADAPNGRFPPIPAIRLSKLQRLRHEQGIVQLYTQVADGAFQLCVAQ